MPFVPPSALTPVQVEAVRFATQHRIQFAIYVEATLSAPPDDGANRRILFGRQGVALTIDFAKVTVRTLIGALSAPELAVAVAVDRRAELHIEAGQIEAVRALLAGRITGVKTLRLYEMTGPGIGLADPRCRRLRADDLPLVAEFYERFYPSTVFSAWMLENPFYGLFEGGSLLAAGGVVAASERLAAANLGNFLTHPGHRGRRLAGAVTASLTRALHEGGVRRFALATNVENRSAWRCYERAGFGLAEERPQVDLRAP